MSALNLPSFNRGENLFRPADTDPAVIASRLAVVDVAVKSMVDVTAITAGETVS